MAGIGGLAFVGFLILGGLDALGLIQLSTDINTTIILSIIIGALLYGTLVALDFIQI